MKSLPRSKRILATGMGAEVAEAAIAAGAHVAIADIDGNDCEGQPRRFCDICVCLGVSDDANVPSGAKQAAESPGGVDGLLNSAATLVPDYAARVTFARFERGLSVDLTSILRVNQAALTYLPRQCGSVGNTLFTQATFGLANSAAFATPMIFGELND
jgi:NAD(P)-dependent dehydrogenase (short-subunit alcohol dehydrogenase family)